MAVSPWFRHGVAPRHPSPLSWLRQVPAHAIAYRHRRGLWISVVAAAYAALIMVCKSANRARNCSRCTPNGTTSSTVVRCRK